jgi:acylphosphatase
MTIAKSPEKAIERLRAMLHVGPPAARVTAVDEQAAEESGAVGFVLR